MSHLTHYDKPMDSLDARKVTPRWSWGDAWLTALAACCFLYALGIAVRYASQLPLDMYSFRQTQTALTAYWLGINGFSLSYETPVLGPPWSIPFEFPIYQSLVAILSKGLGVDLNATGRIVSFLFLALCAYPVSKIAQQRQIPRTSLLIFLALLFSSPLYLYWGRTFMIETAALFFTLMAIRYFIDTLADEATARSGALFIVFMSLAILQKATTPLPVLGVLAMAYLLKSVQDSGSWKVMFSARFIKFSFLYFFIPLLIGTLWTGYTDSIKAENAFGAQLTSSALSEWNWGTWADRTSASLYIDVIWRRLFSQNLAGALGLALIIAGLVLKVRRDINTTIVISVAMGFVPLFIFPNLHIVHEYYQTANLVFLLFAVAVVLGELSSQGTRARVLALILTTGMVAANQITFAKDFLKTVVTVYTEENSRDLAVAARLKAHMQEGEVFVAFGNMWSSSYSYLSGFKSFTVPDRFRYYEHAKIEPQAYLGAYDLGAVVVCPEPQAFLLPEVLRWSKDGRDWNTEEVYGCHIAFPEKNPITQPHAIASTECQGTIDYAGPFDRKTPGVMAVTGWTTLAGEKGTVPDVTYIRLTDSGNNETRYFEATPTSRPDVNAHFGQPDMKPSGFSRLLILPDPERKYVASIVRMTNGQLDACQFSKKVGE